jgi:hypothetical protein
MVSGGKWVEMSRARSTYKRLMLRGFMDVIVVLCCTVRQRSHADASMFFHSAKAIATSRRTEQDAMLSATTVLYTSSPWRLGLQHRSTT